MSTTYYLLRVKGSAMGEGPYLGFGSGGEPEVVPDHATARRFADLPEAEKCSRESGDQFGEFEIEVRNSPT